MKPAKALKDYTSMGDSALENKSFTIAAAMRDNTAFPNPNPSLQQLDTAIQQYSAALALAKNRDRVKIAQKNTLRKALEDQLTLLLHYVNYTAAGNRAMLLTTGYTISAENGNPTIIQVPVNCKIVHGKNSGTITASVSRVKKAKSYVFCIAPAPIVHEQWKVLPSTSRQLLIDGLERGKEYAVRIGAVGANKQTFYCDWMNFIAM